MDNLFPSGMPFIPATKLSPAFHAMGNIQPLNQFGQAPLPSVGMQPTGDYDPTPPTLSMQGSGSLEGNVNPTIPSLNLPSLNTSSPSLPLPSLDGGMGSSSLPTAPTTPRPTPTPGGPPLSLVPPASASQGASGAPAATPPPVFQNPFSNNNLNLNTGLNGMSNGNYNLFNSQNQSDFFKGIGR